MTEQTTYRGLCLTCGTKWPVSPTPPESAATHATVKGHLVQVTTTTTTIHDGTQTKATA